MKKIIIWTLMCSSLLLTSCSIRQEAKSPEDILKQTQSNLIDSSQKTVLSKQTWEFDWDIKFDAELPNWKAKWSMSFSWKWDNKNASINVWLKSEIDAEWKKLKIDWLFDMVVTLEKLYINLSKADIETSDPNLWMITPFIKSFTWKWFSVDNDKDSIKLSRSIANLKIDEKFKKTPFFKIDKVISDREYEISLNKENIKNFIVEVNDWLKSNKLTDEDKAQISKGLEGVDVNGTIKIEKDNKHFSYKWTLSIDWKSKEEFEVKFNTDKFYLKGANVVLDLNRDGDKFEWTASVNIWNWMTETVDLNWELGNDKLVLDVNYNKKPMMIKVSIVYNMKASKVEIKIPEQSEDLQAMMWQFMWWMWWSAGIPQQPSIWTWN